jgi:hypothetical protein
LSTTFVNENELGLRLLIFFPFGATSFFAGRESVVLFVRLFFVVITLSSGDSQPGQTAKLPAWRYRGSRFVLLSIES